MDLTSFHASVIEELHQFDQPLPEWVGVGPYADPQESLDALERREWERLERLERQTRSARGERTRERVARERSRPWDEQNPWGLRKCVWKEQRDAERELLDRRDDSIWQQQQQLERHHARWISELLVLSPDSRDWCVEQTQRREHGLLTLADVEQLWKRRHNAATQHANELLIQTETRARIDRAVSTTVRDTIAIAAALTHSLIEHTDPPIFPPVAVLFAALVRAYSNNLNS